MGQLLVKGSLRRVGLGKQNIYSIDLMFNVPLAMHELIRPIDQLSNIYISVCSDQANLVFAQLSSALV